MINWLFDWYHTIKICFNRSLYKELREPIIFTALEVNENNKYGPQTAEIEQILVKLKDPRNRDAYAAYTAAVDAAYTAAVDAAYTAAVDAAYAADAAWYLRNGVFAVAIKHLIGDTFTQEHYDILYKPLGIFLYLVENTEPGSAEREIACGLTETLGVVEAVTTAKKILEHESI